MMSRNWKPKTSVKHFYQGIPVGSDVSYDYTVSFGVNVDDIVPGIYVA